MDGALTKHSVIEFAPSYDGFVQSDLPFLRTSFAIDNPLPVAPEGKQDYSNGLVARIAKFLAYNICFSATHLNNSNCGAYYKHLFYYYSKEIEKQTNRIQTARAFLEQGQRNIRGNGHYLVHSG
jgi:hypothetical protein